jgi:CBS domain-containing protein
MARNSSWQRPNLRYARPQRSAARRALAGQLISAAGLVGRPVRDAGGQDVGRLVDLVVRWDVGAYPRLTGIIVRVGFRRAFVHDADVAEIARSQVLLSSTRFDLRDFTRRDGEWLVLKDLLDHQLLDVDGARVVRAADVYMARVATSYALVGVDTSFVSFLRRVLPGKPGRMPTPEKVVDWAAVQSFGLPGEPMRLREANSGIRQLRPADLADLLEDLARPERQQLISMLDADEAADVLEEMEPDELEEVLRDASVERAAELLTHMEPDEAVDALRDLPDAERDSILAALAPEQADALSHLLEYDEAEAGGIMTTRLVILSLTDTVQQARDKAIAQRENDEVHGLVVVDDEGRLVDDLPLLDLLAAEPGALVGDVIGPPFPGTVFPDAGLDEVVEQLIANRGSSLLVVDEDGKPLGRIQADDIVDALVESRASRRWPWQTPRLGA